MCRLELNGVRFVARAEEVLATVLVVEVGALEVAAREVLNEAVLRLRDRRMQRLDSLSGPQPLPRLVLGGRLAEALHADALLIVDSALLAALLRRVPVVVTTDVRAEWVVFAGHSLVHDRGRLLRAEPSLELAVPAAIVGLQPVVEDDI